MMGKGAEGGCTRNGCNGNTNLLPFSKGVIQSGLTSRMRGSAGQGLDVFSQVLKSLAIRPAFGELGSVAANSSLTTPISSDSRRKQRVKKNDVGVTSLRDPFDNSWFKDSNGSPFWLQMEEYFREPMPQDVQLLLPKTRLDSWSLCNSVDPLLQMPWSVIVGEKTLQQESEDAVLSPVIKENTMVTCIHSQEDQQNLEEHRETSKIYEQQQRSKRKLSAAGSAGKRRKLASSAFEVITAVISPPENGDEELCHVCFGGDSDDQNQILFCDSCNVAVHQHCYGIKVVPEEQWLCSMCTFRKGANGDASFKESRDCVLCPVKGGALKPIASSKDPSSKDPAKAVFGHLFCCQWVPETYIGDMVEMEPIMNVERVREERWKLLCSICKDKHGACIQCSHGLCATAFHPLCARQSRLRMEVSSKANGDELEFHAFCPKHKMQGGKPSVNMQLETGSEHGALHSNGGVIASESFLNKVCKKFKAATSWCKSNPLQAGADGVVINAVGLIKSNLNTTRGPAMNGDLGSSSVKGSRGLTDSTSEAFGNATNIISNQGQTNLVEQSNSISHDSSDEGITPHDRGFALNREKTSSDSGVHENGQFWISGSIYSSDVPKLLPALAGRRFVNDETKGNTESNSKDKSCGAYRNKRRKLEQQVITQIHPKEEILSQNNQGVENSCLGESLETQHDSTVGPDNQNLQDATSMSCNQCAEVLANFVEKRRQRGLSGEASTSHDFSFPSQRAAQLFSWKNVSKGVEVGVVPVSVMEQKSTPRSNGGANLHPLLLTRLLEAENGIAERSPVNETGEMLESFQFSDNFLASASPFIEVQQIKVPRSKRYQFEGFIQKQNLASKSANNGSSESLEAQLKQLEHAKKTGILDMAPENELEGEILALELSLIAQAKRNHLQCEQLVLKIIPNLSKELRASQKRTKDLALVNHYLSMLREAKKQGRKERRSKEAQAVLAAATAVAAASSRVGALRKDTLGNLVNNEKPYLARESFGPPMMATSLVHGVDSRPSIPKPTSYGWTSSSQTSSCGKASSFEEKINTLDSRNYVGDLNFGESKEQFIVCDICKDFSSSSPTIVCHRCGVSVHRQCYGVDVSLTSDWHCQPCIEISRQSHGCNDSDITDRATPGHGVVCSLCLGRSGAFKKSVDSKWVHVFCVQWVHEGFAEKDEGGQHEPVKNVPVEKNLQECSVCHTKQGASLRCSFGHCHGAFHPLCARDSGLYMNVKRSPGGRIQYRAYCKKHSAQQRQKAASKKYGSSDELNGLLQVRAELERVRILCERVCKRERIKRDSLLCTLDVHAAHLSSMSSSAMASNDLSSTSNTLDTTFAFRNISSLRMQHNDPLTATLHRSLESESYSWSSIAGEGNRYQDSLSSDSAYQTQISCSELSRETPARSQLSDAAAFHGQGRLNVLVGAMPNNWDQKRPGRHQKAETLHTEVVMTPTEASVQNQRLPKGYAYVPVGTLPKSKVNLSEASALKDL